MSEGRYTVQLLLLMLHTKYQIIEQKQAKKSLTKVDVHSD